MLDTTFSRLVGGIYDAVVEPDLWTEAVDAIRREFDFHIAMMGISKMPANELVVNVSTNVPASFVGDIVRYGEDIMTLWGGPAAMARIPIEEPTLQSLTYPPHWREKS